MIFLNSAVFTFLAVLIGVPVFLGIFRIFGVYMIVQERSCCVYVLVGKVVDVLDQPGLYFLPAKLGLAPFFVNIFGKCYVLDIRLDQEYRRSEPVNSEERAHGHRHLVRDVDQRSHRVICSRIPTRAVRCGQTSAAPPSAA